MSMPKVSAVNHLLQIPHWSSTSPSCRQFSSSTEPAWVSITSEGSPAASCGGGGHQRSRVSALPGTAVPGIQRGGKILTSVSLPFADSDSKPPLTSKLASLMRKTQDHEFARQSSLQAPTPHAAELNFFFLKLSLFAHWMLKVLKQDLCNQKTPPRGRSKGLPKCSLPWPRRRAPQTCHRLPRAHGGGVGG